MSEVIALGYRGINATGLGAWETFAEGVLGVQGANLGGAAPLAMTFGRHTNDHMTSFYVNAPSGFEVEFGTNGRAIDESSWVVSHYDEMSCRGHKRSLTDAPVV